MFYKIKYLIWMGMHYLCITNYLVGDAILSNINHLNWIRHWWVVQCFLMLTISTWWVMQCFPIFTISTWWVVQCFLMLTISTSSPGAGLILPDCIIVVVILLSFLYEYIRCIFKYEYIQHLNMYLYKWSIVVKLLSFLYELIRYIFIF